MKEMVIIYLVMSFIVFITTIKTWSDEAKYLASFPAGDIGYYIFPSDNYGKLTARHYIFVPSIIFIKAFLVLNGMLKRVL